MNNCINIKIEESLKDKNIIRIMNKASSSFRKSLDVDNIYSCQLNALWKCFVNFKPEKNTKFTTYLYRGVVIECMKALKFEKKMDFCKNKLHENISKKDNNPIIAEIIDSLESQEDIDLIIDKYHNLTIQEMADKRLYSRETVRKKLKKIYNNLQKQFK